MRLILLIFITVFMQMSVLGNTFIGLATQENGKDEFPLFLFIGLGLVVFFIIIKGSGKGGSGGGWGGAGCGSSCGGCGGGD